MLKKADKAVVVSLVSACRYDDQQQTEREKAFGLELYETANRGYDPQLGRFWQVEPLADIFVGVNVYQFGYNNPISFNDPSGLDPIDGECPSCGLIGGFHNPHNTSTSASNFDMWMWFSGSGGMSAGECGGFAMGNGGGASFRKPTADRMVLTSSRNQRAQITIINFGDNPDINGVKSILETTFINLGMNVDVNIVCSAEGLTPDAASGINAVYLFGNNEKGKHYDLMYKAVQTIYPNSGFEEKVADLKTVLTKRGVSTTIEKATGWGYRRTAENLIRFVPQQLSVSGGNANIAIFATNLMGRFLKTDNNPQMSNSHIYALFVLHVMGHNAGLNHPAEGSDWTSPIADGGRLWDMIKNGFSYERIVHPRARQQDLSYRLWNGFVGRYFSSSMWNGNLQNATFTLDFIKWHKLFDPYLNISNQ